MPARTPASSLPELPIVLPPGTAPVRVGYSGGLDSSVLLHRLAVHPAIRERGLAAVHVHHGLHAEADAWAAHCGEQCAVLQVPLRVIHVAVERNSALGREAAARAARHAAFHAALAANDVLALAHHRDDQAETFLLRALRASGPDGLGAMRSWRPFGDAWLWRPLLALPRSALRAYAQQHALRWIEDSGNRDVSFDRNFLRHQVLPLLQQRWPHADAAFARAATLCADTGDLLADDDARALPAMRGDIAGTLSIAALQTLPASRRARVLRRWISASGLPTLPAQGVAEVESWLSGVRRDGRAAFAWHGAVLHMWRDVLQADMQRPPFPADWHAPWDGAEALVLPDGGRLVLEGVAAFDDIMHVHARRGGERIVLPGRRHSHALKHVLQELGVPPWLRARLPLISDAQGSVLAAGDVVCAAALDRWLRQRDARLHWLPAHAGPAAQSQSLP